MSILCQSSEHDHHQRASDARDPVGVGVGGVGAARTIEDEYDCVSIRGQTWRRRRRRRRRRRKRRRRN
jgi:hypothetical protein